MVIIYFTNDLNRNHVSMYIMTKGLTLQTDREIRYEQRNQRKRIQQQNVDRVIRLENRANSQSDRDIGNRNEIANEVSNEIIRLTQKGRVCNSRYSNFVSFFS